jgi:hypothetical protein
MLVLLTARLGSDPTQFDFPFRDSASALVKAADKLLRDGSAFPNDVRWYCTD